MASQYWDYKIVKLLIESGADINAKDISGDTVLKWATILNKGHHLDIVQYLADSGANVSSKNSVGMTDLIWASLLGNFEVDKYLVESGADVNIKRYGGETALNLAKTEEIREVLIKAVATD